MLSSYTNYSRYPGSTTTILKQRQTRRAIHPPVMRSPLSFPLPLTRHDTRGFQDVLCEPEFPDSVARVDFNAGPNVTPQPQRPRHPRCALIASVASKQSHRRRPPRRRQRRRSRFPRVVCKTGPMTSARARARARCGSPPGVPKYDGSAIRAGGSTFSKQAVRAAPAKFRRAGWHVRRFSILRLVQPSSRRGCARREMPERSNATSRNMDFPRVA